MICRPVRVGSREHIDIRVAFGADGDVADGTAGLFGDIRAEFRRIAGGKVRFGQDDGDVFLDIKEV